MTYSTSNKYSSCEGMPIFCHFLNRELHDSIENKIDCELYKRHIQYLTIFHNEPLFCNISQIFEAAGSCSALADEIKELSRCGIFFAHSEHSRIEEFIESRKSLYWHDKERYPVYFTESPHILTDMLPASMGEEGSTTSFIHRNMASWDPQDPKETASKVISLADKKIITPYASQIQSIVSQRGERGLTAALFRDEKALISDPRTDGGIRRLLSALYVSHYCTEFNAARSWGLPGLSYYDDDFRQALLNHKIMEALLSVTGLKVFLDSKENFRRHERINEYYSFQRNVFIQTAKRISDALKTTFFADHKDGAAEYGVLKAVRALERYKTLFPPFPDDLSYLNALEQCHLRVQKIIFELSNTIEEFRVSIERNDSITPMVLIATATELEDEVLREIFEKDGIEKIGTDYSGRSSVHHYGRHGGVDVCHVRSSAGSLGPSGSEAVISDALRQTGAQYVISAGICFGMQPNKQSLGDIAISSKVRLYEAQRVNQSFWPFSKPNITPRGALSDASALLLDRTWGLRKGWNECKVFEGIIMSGEKLVDNKSFIDGLKSIEPEAVAGEMEGSGLCSIGERERVEWIIIKGICDWGFGKTKGAQKQAAENAFKFVTKLIKSNSLNSKAVVT